MDDCGGSGGHDHGSHFSHTSSTTYSSPQTETHSSHHLTAVHSSADHHSSEKQAETSREYKTDRFEIPNHPALHSAGHNSSGVAGASFETCYDTNDATSTTSNAYIASPNKSSEPAVISQSSSSQQLPTSVGVERSNVAAGYTQPAPPYTTHSGNVNPNYPAHHPQQQWQQYPQNVGGVQPTMYAVTTPPMNEFNVPVDVQRVQTSTIVCHNQAVEHVPDYMGSSIFTTLCCCLCFGIAAIVFSSEANSLRYTDPPAAARKARLARTMIFIGVGFGLLSITASLILRFTLLQQ